MPPIFGSRIWKRILIAALVLVPIVAHTQPASPFDTKFSNMQTLTGTIAQAASLIAIVIGGYQSAHGEPSSKKVRIGASQMHDQ
jgi:hypothetical protein